MEAKFSTDKFGPIKLALELPEESHQDIIPHWGLRIPGYQGPGALHTPGYRGQDVTQGAPYPGEIGQIIRKGCSAPRYRGQRFRQGASYLRILGHILESTSDCIGLNTQGYKGQYAGEKAPYPGIQRLQ
jgi:hypothetical protein